MYGLRLCLMRHGVAEEGVQGPDSDRALTAGGVDEVRHMARWMASLNLGLARVCASPYLRARQTAEIVCEVLGIPLELWPALTPAQSPMAAVAQAQSELFAAPQLWVSHQPLVSQLAALLLSDRAGLTPAIDFQKGALLTMQIAAFKAPFQGVLTGYVTPAMNRAAMNQEKP